MRIQPVRVRIEAANVGLLYEAAKQMGMYVSKVYPMRNNKGFMGYGVKKVEIK